MLFFGFSFQVVSAGVGLRRAVLHPHVGVAAEGAGHAARRRAAQEAAFCQGRAAPGLLY